MNIHGRNFSPPRLALGVVMVVLGGLLVLERLSLVAAVSFWRLWPLAMVGVGLARLFQYQDAGSSQMGLWLLISGGWLLIVNLGMFGLTARTSLPFLLIGLGGTFVWQALGRPRTSLPSGSEVRHGR